VSRVDPSGWYAEATQRCRMDGGPGLHPSIRSKVTMILAPDGSLLYLAINYIGYFESVTIFLENLINGQCPIGSKVVEKTYEPSCDSSGLDQYGMDTMVFAESSAYQWQIDDISQSPPMIIGQCIGGATIIIGGAVLICYVGPKAIIFLGTVGDIRIPAGLYARYSAVKDGIIGLFSGESFEEKWKQTFGSSPNPLVQIGFTVIMALIPW